MVNNRNGEILIDDLNISILQINLKMVFGK